MKRLFTLLCMTFTVCNLIIAEEYYLPFPSGGRGIAEDPYRLNTIADWRYLAEWMQSGASFEATSFCMDNDVDFGEVAAIDESGSNFLPLGQNGGSSVSFKGNLDGKGHTIKNMRIIRSYLGSNGVWNDVYDCSGLFHHLEDALVKNLTIGEGSEFIGPTYSGSIAGYCTNSQIANCTSYAYVHGSGYGDNSGVGGIVGATFGIKECMISKCRNAGTVEGTWHAGGIVGSVTMEKTTISECVNEGTVSCKGSRVGGILGKNMNNDVTISYCINRGTVLSYTDPYSTAANDGVGGIVGIMGLGVIDHCTNEGMVSRPGYSSPVLEGGIVGKATDATVSYCSNTAPVIQVGCGIAGLAQTIKHCTNTGNVIKTGLTTTAITQGAAVMEDNYYTQNVVTNYYDEYNGINQEVSGAVCRGYYNWGYKDIDTDNGAILGEITLTGSAAAGSYWTTFYRGCGNYKVDDNCTVYTATAAQGETGSATRRLVLTKVSDGIIKAQQPVILQSTQPQITLTITSDTPVEVTASDNTLLGYDKPIPETGKFYELVTDGTGVQFSISPETTKPVNTAYIGLWEDRPTITAYRLEIDGEVIPGLKVPATGINIANNYAAVMSVGQTQQLSAITTPSDATDKKVIWSSSNELVLTVSETGLVTAVGTGTAQITATANDTTNGTLTDIISITVNPLTMSVTAEGYTGTYDGEAHGITVTVIEPDDATVKYGTTEGTYDLDENPMYTDAGEYVVYYQVTKPNYTTVNGSAIVSISKAAGTIGYEVADISKLDTDAPFTNELTLTGDGKVSYTSDNANAATVNIETGEVTIVAAGMATITVTVTDGTNYSYAIKSASYRLMVTVDPAMGILSPTTGNTGHLRKVIDRGRLLIQMPDGRKFTAEGVQVQ